MKANLNLQKVTVPIVYVTKDKQRVKQYNGSIVYLKNGDEFELELFNPTTSKVLAKITLNGKSLGSGIILRPGERVFLERYFDEAKKFLFETYEINAKDSDAKEATKLNGIAEVHFYDEYKPQVYVAPYTYTYVYTWPGWTYVTTPITPPYRYYNCTDPNYNCTDSISIGSNQLGNATYPQANSVTFGNVSGCTTGALYSCNANAKSYVNTKSEKEPLLEGFADNFAPMETGRVEKGSNSNQSFTYDSTIFNTYYTWNYTWKILPESQRPLVKEDLKVFCLNCGAKRKKSTHKFCPNCGQKFN